MAIENDVHAICFLSTESKHKSLIIDLTRELKGKKADNVRIVMGGAIPRSDYNFLYDAGVALILSSMMVDKTEIKRLLELFV